MKQEYRRIITTFLIFLFVLSALQLVWPTQQISKDENRTLKQFPPLNWDDLKTGKWTQDFEDYYQDQFAMRQFFMEVNTRIQNLFKLKSGDGVELIKLIDQPNLGVGEALHPDDTDLMPDVSQATDPDETEPSLTETTTSITTLMTSQSMTTETTDSAPSDATEAPTTTTSASTAAPTTPTTVQPITEPEVRSVNSLILVDDRVMEVFGYSPANCQRYADLINKLHTKLGSGVRMFNMLIPTAVQFYAPERYHSGTNSQDNVIADIYKRMNSAVITVDTYAQIAPHAAKEYLYFRTDHHWTQRGAYYAYAAFTQKAGFQAAPIDSYPTGRVPGAFLGSLYRLSGNLAVLKNNPDYVEYYLPQNTSKGQAYSADGQSPAYALEAIRTGPLSTDNKYLAFIGGDVPLTRFTSSNTSGRKVLVIKESFGNAFVPFLIDQYSEVYVIDPRKATFNLIPFVQKNAINDVIVINYTFITGNKPWMDALNKMIA